jgi:hypothetical protein
VGGFLFCYHFEIVAGVDSAVGAFQVLLFDEFPVAGLFLGSGRLDAGEFVLIELCANEIVLEKTLHFVLGQGAELLELRVNIALLGVVVGTELEFDFFVFNVGFFAFVVDFAFFEDSSEG